MTMSSRPVLVILGSVRDGRHAVSVGRLVKNALDAQGLNADIVGEISFLCWLQFSSIVFRSYQDHYLKQFCPSHII